MSYVLFWNGIIWHEVFYASFGGAAVLVGQGLAYWLYGLYKKPRIGYRLDRDPHRTGDTGKSFFTIYPMNVGRTAFFDPIICVKFSKSKPKMTLTPSNGMQTTSCQYNEWWFKYNGSLLPDAEQCHIAAQLYDPADTSFPPYLDLKIFSSNHGLTECRVVINKESDYPSAMKNFKYLGLITALYITMQLVSDVTAGKIVQLGMFTVSATVLYFPITYIFSDILTEVYGFAQARKVLWMVLASSVLAGLIYQLVVALPAASGFDGAQAYARVLGSVPRILLGGWIAVWVGGMLNDYILAKMKVATNGKHLWMRTIGSTVVGEFANTVLFYTIALYAVIPNSLLLSSILSGWFLKVLVEVIFTPVTYAVVAKLKKTEDEDYYDRQTNFNPLRF